MPKSIPEQLRFPPVDGMTVRADFEGGTLSSASFIRCCRIHENKRELR